MISKIRRGVKRVDSRDSRVDEVVQDDRGCGTFGCTFLVVADISRLRFAPLEMTDGGAGGR